MELSIIEKAKVLAHMLKWRLTWERRDLEYVHPGVDNPKFMNARDAVRLIEDGDVVLSCGMAANARCSIFYWGLKDYFLSEGHPLGLTWIGVGAMGSRGKAPGSLEELNFPGPLARYIGGHLETIKAQLKLASEGHLELQTMPQGVMAFLFEAQARGEDSILTDVGVGTFLDPRLGPGTQVVPGKGENLVIVEGDLLRYRLPKINVTMFVAPYADHEGNIYFHNAATHTENVPGARAARANGGKVLVSVCDVIKKDESRISLAADMVDAVVVNPYSEQTGSVPQRKYWPLFTVGANEDVEKEVARLKFANEALKITPVRRAPELAMSRVAARVFTRLARPGAEVNIGVGLPEEVSRVIREGGLTDDVNFATETGVWGGLPTPGVFFGAAVNPKKMMSSAQIFEFWKDNLDVTILGLLEADSEGNVNVSRRGTDPVDFVGPGGFPNLVRYAKSILFVGAWMAGGKIELAGGKVKIVSPGEYKFKERVSEITFSGKVALAQGKTVYYVTNVGVFHLTERGMELIEIMPGLDPEKDVIEPCPMRIVRPESGEIEVIGENVVTGKGFELNWSGD